VGLIYEHTEIKPGLVKLGFHSGKYNFLEKVKHIILVLVLHLLEQLPFRKRLLMGK
jgi:hypothetical protein